MCRNNAVLPALPNLVQLRGFSTSLTNHAGYAPLVVGTSPCVGVPTNQTYLDGLV
jgi:hypothetical protein